MMIPGAWEPRPRSIAVVAPLILAPKAPSDSRVGSSGPALSGVEGPARAELPGWLKVSIFAATLLAATWLAMAMFF